MEVKPVAGPGFCVVLAGMSTDIFAVGSAGQEEGVTLRLRGSAGPKGRSLLFSLVGNLDRGCYVGPCP